MKLVIPEDYKSNEDLYRTQLLIKEIKDYFQINLANNLNLKRVSAPLFVSTKSGLNDNLNGVEKPVSFNLPEADNEKMEIVHSLAKWKNSNILTICKTFIRTFTINYPKNYLR